MTDYAESRIAGLLKNKYDKTEIINTLEEEAFRHKDYKLIFWLKSGRFIEISYLDEDNKPFNEKLKLLDFDGDMLKVAGEDGKQRLIDYNDIKIGNSIVFFSSIMYAIM
jgi:hypothetical protein